MAAGVMCPDHPEEKLRFLCVPCDRLVCRDCKLTDHEGHKSVDVAKTSDDTRQKVSKPSNFPPCLYSFHECMCSAFLLNRLSDPLFIRPSLTDSSLVLGLV